MNSMSVQDLIKLNKQLVTIIKEKQRMDNRVASVCLMAGDEVTYTSGRTGMPVKGKIIEVKRTKVVVQSNLGRYLVPASMLKKV
jgi:ribosomal protein L35AE/L33A